MDEAVVREAYEGALDHLEECFERVRLLLTRHLARHWKRSTQDLERLNDLFVSLDEVRQSICPWGGAPEASAAPSAPTLEVVESRLLAHEAWMRGRLEATSEAGVELPVETFRARCELTSAELDVVLVLLALQVHVGLHRLATWVWGDFTQRQPTLGFLAEVVGGGDGAAFFEVERMGWPGHRLQRLRLLEWAPSDRWRTQTPVVHRNVRLSDRVVAYLLGQPAALDGGGARVEHDDVDVFCRHYGHEAELPEFEPGAGVEGLLPAMVREAYRLGRSGGGGGLASEVPLLVLAGPDVEDHLSATRRCVFSGGLLTIDLTRALSNEVVGRVLVEQLLALGLREALLLMATPVVVLGELLERRESMAPILAGLERALRGWRELVVVSVRTVPQELRVVFGVCAEVFIPPPPPSRRLELWSRALERHQIEVEDPDGLEDLASRFVLSGGPIDRVAARVSFEQRVRGGGRRRDVSMPTQQLKSAVSWQIQHGLEHLADIVTTELSWGDVVLPPQLLEQLQEMVSHTRHRRLVFEQWGFRRIDSGQGGVAALFYGPPGTGKTVSASIMARELGVDLYRVDLSRIVSKWIGETEKNLARLFDEAERARGVLLFDEADSLFAQRSAVKSSNDRNANLEVNYLLQRIERFDGIAILTTNFPESIDEAFQRRLRFRLEFPMPDASERADIWRRLLPSDAPVEEGVDFAQLGKRFEMSPGHIKNAILRAAFRAAGAGRSIGLVDLRSAAEDEYRAMGRIVMG